MTRRSALVLGCVMMCLTSLASPTSHRHDSPGPYEDIVYSNVFRLRPPTPPVIAKPPPPTAKVRLVGITGLLGKELALLKVEVVATPGHPAQQFSATLAGGQADRGVRVLHIDPKARRVEVDSFGTEMALEFEPEQISAPAQSRPVLASNPAMASGRWRPAPAGSAR